MEKEFLLHEKLTKVTKDKRRSYSRWEKAVRENDEENIEKYRMKLIELDGVGIKELLELGYLQYDSEFYLTYKLGDNRENEFLHKFAFYHTTDYGLVDESYNDYYEVARLQGELLKSLA